MKHIFEQDSPPVNLKKAAIGDGSLGSFATIRHLPVVCRSYTVIRVAIGLYLVSSTSSKHTPR